MKPALKTTARQFFDIWCTCTEALGKARRYTDAKDIYSADAVNGLRERHGNHVAVEGRCYYARLRIDAQNNISSL